MFSNIMLSTEKWNKVTFRVQLTRIRQALMILVFLVSLVGGPTASVKAAECTDPLGCVDIGPADPFHIAYALAVSGDVSFLGIDERNGIEIAIDAVGGQILGHDILFDGVDSECSDAGGLAAGTALAADPTIVAVIGTSCSSAAVSAMPVLSAAGLVMVSPSNTASSLTESGNPENHPGYLRTVWNDNAQAPVLAHLAQEYLGVSAAATIEDGSSYSDSLQQIFVDEFTSLGGTVTDQVAISIGQTDMSTELATIASGNPGLIYMPIFMPEGGHLISQAKGVPGLEGVFLIGSDSLYTEDVVNSTGDDVEGFMVTGPDFTKFSEDYENSLLPAYQAKFGYEPTSMFHAYAYDAFMMIKAAIEAVAVVDVDGSVQIGRQALRDALYATTDFPGITGSLTCSATGDCADTHIGVFEYHAGQYPPELIWPDFAPLSLTAPNCDNGRLLQSVNALNPLTVEFGLCRPDAAFLQRMAMSPFGIYPEKWLEATSGPANRTAEGLEMPVGTGPYMVSDWDKGNSLTLTSNPEYWGAAPETDSLVFTWQADPADRLLALQASTVDGYDNVAEEDYGAIASDPNLQLVTRLVPNTAYLGMTNTFTPFDDVRVRQAIAMGINRQDIVDTFYPPNSEVATHFTPCGIPNGCVGDDWYTFNPTAAQALLADAGYPTGFSTTLYYRDVDRLYLPQVGNVALNIQAQLLTNLGIDATIVVLDSSTFVSQATSGNLDGLYLLGWVVDYPHVSNFLDYHFGENNPQFGNPFPDIYNNLNTASQYADPALAEPYYTAANNAIKANVPMVPLAHGALAVAYRADVTNPQASPAGGDFFAGSDPGGRATFNWIQAAEPLSLFCADESDGESLRACNQVMQGLYTFENNSTTVEPALATSCTPNIDLTVWTCDLRPNVKFHDGSLFDANDVVATFIMGLDEAAPTHKGNSNIFEYYNFIFGSISPSYGYTLHAVPSYPEVHGHDWPPGAEVTLTIDDDNDPGNGVLYTETKNADDEPLWCGYPCFDLDGVFPLAAGHYVSMSDGEVTKTVLVSPMVITAVDPDADTVSGVGDPGERLAVNIWSQGGIARYVTIEPDGTWVADFSVFGDEDFEQNTADIGPGDNGRAIQLNPDDSDDGTLEYWNVLNPNLHVFVTQDRIEARDWPNGSLVTLTIDNPGTPQSPDYTDTRTIGPAPWNPDENAAEFDLNGIYHYQVGDLITVSDGTLTKVHTVASVAVTNIDPAAETISGTTDPDAEIQVEIHQGGAPYRRITADGSGQWTVDFSTPWDDQGTYDLAPGLNGAAMHYDADGDASRADWSISNPNFSARFPEKEVHGYEWPLGANVTVSIDDPGNGVGEDYTDTQTVIVAPWDPNQTFVQFTLNGFDLQPGFEITLNDGTTTKTHTVSSLAVTDVDVDFETVAGTVEAGSEVHVDANCGDQGCAAFRREFADGNGDWSADFSTPGEDGDEQDTTDVGPGSSGEVRAPDSDGDSTTVQWNVPNPRIEARTNEERVEGYEWPLGATVTLEINDPGTPQNPDYTANGTVEVANWDPNQTYFNIDFRDMYDLKPGDTVSVTDGVTTKGHTLTSLTITGIDPVTDIVTGTAEAGSPISVWACDNQNCYNREETTGQDGNWSTDFGELGPGQQTFDIVAGTWVDSGQWDEDGDGTLYGMNLPNPSIDVWYQDGHINAYSWPLGAVLTLDIEDPGTPESPDYTTTTTVVVANWDSNDTLGEFNLNGAFSIEPGMTVTVSGASMTKELVIIDLTITSFDPDTDIITGNAEPNQMLWTHWDNNPDGYREFQADGSGIWTVDYSQPGLYGEPIQDIQPGSSGNINAQDEDGDNTSLHWFVPNPTFSVRFPENQVHGYEWPLGASVTLYIDDLSVPGWPDYTGTHTVGVADWDPNQTFVLFDLGSYEIQPGHLVTMTDGDTTKTHTVRDLAVTAVDPVADTVAGTAEPGAVVEVGHIFCDETGCYGFRRVTADVNGNWVADFAHVGEDDDEQDLFDIIPGATSEARQPDSDWDNTAVQWFAGWVAPETVPLVVALDQDVSLENYEFDTDTANVLNLLLEGLYRNDVDGTLVPAAALDYAVSLDGLTYTVTLRDDGMWSDGVPVTAQHYVDGIIFLLDPATGFNYPGLFFPILNAQAYNEGSITDPNLVGVSAPNASTLVITLGQPAAHFEKLLSSPSLMPVRADLMALYGDAWADAGNFVGNGPYKLDERDGAHLLLSHNPYYRNLGRLAFGQIGFSVIPFTEYKLAAYQNGDVDVILNLPSIPDDPGLAADVDILPLPGVNVMGFDVAVAPTNDPLVRLALASAIDRQGVLDALGTPWRDIATGVIPPELPGYQGGAIGYAYNPTQAQAYLVQAGYPGGAGLPPIELFANIDSPRATIVEEVAAQWRAVLGITVNITYFYTWDEYWTVQNACQADPTNCAMNAISGGWITDYPDAYNILNDLFHPDNAIYTPGWDNVDYRNALAASELETDPAARLLLLQDAERILVETDAAVIPFYHYDQLVLIRPGLYTAPVSLYVQYLDQWGNSDVDSDGLHDLIDPCPEDDTNTCDATGSAAAVVGSSGGTVSTENNNVLMDIPPNAVAESITFTITDNGAGYIVSTDLGQIEAITSAEIGPGGTTFAVPVPLTFHWPDANNDGIVDGSSYAETDLQLSKDGIVIAACSDLPSPCDLVDNTITVEVSSLSVFVIGASPAACYSLTTSTNPAGGGSIQASPEPNCLTETGKYQEGTAVSLTATPNTGYTFVDWSGDGTGTSNPLSVTMDGDKSVTANFTGILTPLTPAGTLTEWDKRFSWTGLVDATWYLLEVQTSAGTQVFRQWYTSAQTNCSGGTACSVTPVGLNLANGDYKWRVLDYGAYGYGTNSAFLNFTLDLACYTLTTSVNPTGSGTVNASAQNCTGGYTAGTQVQVTAVSNSGYVFDTWSGAASGSGNPVSVTMDGDKSLTANFEATLNPLLPSGTLTEWDKRFSWTGLPDATWYLLEVQTSAGTQVFRQWYTSAQTNCSGGTACSVTPAGLSLANGDYKWRVMDYGAYGYGTNSAFLNFTLDLACYTLTTSVNPTGSGTVNASAQNCTGGYTAGTQVQVTAVPNSGYAFDAWSGAASGSSNPVSVTMDGDKSLTANFEATLNPLSPSGTLSDWDKSFSWTGLVDATWYLLEVQTSGGTQVHRQWYTSAQTNCSGGTACSVTPAGLNLENGDYKWRVMDYGAYGYGTNSAFLNFTLDLACYTLTTNVNPTGSGTVNASAQTCAGGYTEGSLVQVTAVPNSGYAFDTWSGAASGSSNPVSVTMDGDKSLTANFEATVVLIAPQGEVSGWDNSFSWTGLSNATWYLLEVYNTGGTQVYRQWYTSAQAGCAGGTACAVTLTAGLADGDYRWYILDYGGYGYGTWTPAMEFSLNQ